MKVYFNLVSGPESILDGEGVEICDVGPALQEVRKPFGNCGNLAT
jgi:hypothetical protein